MTTTMGSRSPAPTRPELVLSARDVVKSFGSTRVLDGISLDVRRGEAVVIIGPSGSGKTTFLRCINHLEPIDAGQIHVNGHPMGYREGADGPVERPPRAVAKSRRNVGFVFQKFNLFPHLTALDNVSVAPMRVLGVPKKEAHAQARALLDRVGLASKESAYPGALSGGQQQRVAIARALAMKPALMLFDEPTSALDPEMVGEVISVMKELAADGMTMLVVSHEMEFARSAADRMVVFDDGVIVEQGAPAELIDNPRAPRTKSFLSRLTSSG